MFRIMKVETTHRSVPSMNKKKFNPMAFDLRSSKYRKRIVLSKKVYSRKDKHKKEATDTEKESK